jgi:hypothetical protein
VLAHNISAGDGPGRSPRTCVGVSARGPMWKHSAPSYLLTRLYFSVSRPWAPSCCDSRADPAIVFDADPGDMFVCRNVASLVPPYTPDEGHHGGAVQVDPRSTPS